MTNPAQLREMIKAIVNEVAPLRFAKVSALNADGTVNLAFGGGIIEAVPCSSGYPNRAIDDVIIAARAPAGNWEVLVKSNVPPEDPEASEAILETAVGDVNEDMLAEIADVRGDIPPWTRVVWGNGSPADPSWIQADATWFRDAGSGNREVYFNMAAVPPAPSPAPIKPPKPPPLTAPKSVTLQPTAEGSWRTSGQTDDGVWQGTWTSRGNWLGAWFYGSTIADACSGKSVKSMVLTLSRTNSGGWNRGVPVHIGLHDRQTRGKPSKETDDVSPFKLEPGQVRSWTLSASFRNSLASGDNRGFYVTGSGQADYLHYGGASGKLVISYNPS